MDFTTLSGHFKNSTTPMLRTDFSDDAAWERVIAEVTKEVDFGYDEANDIDGRYAANVTPIADRAFEGARGASLAEAHDNETYGYVLLADAQSMREALNGGELTVVYVDLSVDPESAEEFGDVLGREFRCAAPEVASIETDLAIANMDFEEFADNVDDDGVFRGFDD